MMSTPGITGWCGKWPAKKCSLIVTFLTRDDAFSRIAGQHLVHQQERIAVRQVFEYLMYVHAVHGLFPFVFAEPALEFLHPLREFIELAQVAPRS